MNVVVKVIPHKEQRYPTVGDWWFEGDEPDLTLQIRVSAMSDWRYEALVAMHEQAEALLCYDKGISDAAVTAFDVSFESAKAAGAPFHGRVIENTQEPGDDPEAPYYTQHQIASVIERLLATEMDVVWGLYDEEVAAL